MNEDGFQRAQKYGLIYTTLLPVKKAGPYQVRATCGDEASGKIGSGGEFVSIQQVKDDHVVLAAGPSAYTAGQTARFAIQVSAEKAGRLEMRARLFRDGAEIWQSGAMAVEGEGAEGNGSGGTTVGAWQWSALTVQ